MADIFTEVVNNIGAPKYNGMDIFGTAGSLGVDISVTGNKRTDTIAGRPGTLFRSGSNTVKRDTYSYNDAQLKSYYEAFTGAATQRKQQMQLFGKQAASTNIF